MRRKTCLIPILQPSENISPFNDELMEIECVHTVTHRKYFSQYMTTQTKLPVQPEKTSLGKYPESDQNFGCANELEDLKVLKHLIFLIMLK